MDGGYTTLPGTESGPEISLTPTLRWAGGALSMVSVQDELKEANDADLSDPGFPRLPTLTCAIQHSEITGRDFRRPISLRGRSNRVV